MKNRIKTMTKKSQNLARGTKRDDFLSYTINYQKMTKVVFDLPLPACLHPSIPPSLPFTEMRPSHSLSQILFHSIHLPVLRVFPAASQQSLQPAHLHFSPLTLPTFPFAFTLSSTPVSHCGSFIFFFLLPGRMFYFSFVHSLFFPHSFSGHHSCCSCLYFHFFSIFFLLLLLFFFFFVILVLSLLPYYSFLPFISHSTSLLSFSSLSYLHSSSPFSLLVLFPSHYTIFVLLPPFHHSQSFLRLTFQPAFFIFLLIFFILPSPRTFLPPSSFLLFFILFHFLILFVFLLFLPSQNFLLSFIFSSFSSHFLILVLSFSFSSWSSSSFFLTRSSLFFFLPSYNFLFLFFFSLSFSSHFPDYLLFILSFTSFRLSFLSTHSFLSFISLVLLPP